MKGAETRPGSDPPEPLRRFDHCAEALAPQLRRLDEIAARYRSLRDAHRVLDNSVEAMRVELTYHSNAIEGSTLTLRETQLIIEGHAPTSGKSLREVYEARNHDRALRAIERWAVERPWPAPGSSLMEGELLETHALVMADIDPANAGRLRTERVLIRGTRFIPPGAHRFGELVPALLLLANRDDADGPLHPVLRAAELHYNLVAVHPFTDGNGRTARLLMNLSLLCRGWAHVVIEVTRRGEYLAALEEANAGRCDAFASLVVESAETSLLRLIGA